MLVLVNLNDLICKIQSWLCRAGQRGFIDKSFRHHGISGALLKGVISYAKEKGIKVIEAYPAIPTKEHLPDSFLWVGLYSAFKKAGFEVVDRTSPNRPMVRYYTDRISSRH